MGVFLMRNTWTNVTFYCFRLVHDVLSDDESPTKTTINKNVDTNNAFNVFSTSDDDQTESKKK